MMPHKEISISIIIPVYNVERYLPVCLESIVQQFMDDYEVILVDDGSTDSSGAICNEYADRHPQFHVIHQQNQGISAARNTGIVESKGKYLLFLDSDDFLVPNSLSIMLELANKNNLDVLGFSLTYVTEDCNEYPVKQSATPELAEVMSGFDYMARNNYVAQVWWYITRRELIVENDIKFPEGHMLEDAAFNVRLFSKTQRMAQVPNIVYCYRQRPESIMHNRDKEHQLRLMWDYLYAASDVGTVLNDVDSKMNEKCYDRCRSRRDSYVFFGAIRAFKLGKVNEFLRQAREKKLYPFERLSEKDYPGTKFKVLHWCITKAWLWRTLSFFYKIFK